MATQKQTVNAEKSQHIPAAFALRNLTLLLAVAAACGSASALAQSAATLKEVVVSATRSETSTDNVPATVTVIDRQALERRMPHDEASVFQDEADVVVGRDLRRFGASSVNIRGIEGNRVLQMVDGVRLPDYYSGGGPSNTTTASSDSPEIAFLKRVEILRGPASSLYGSDALGGVVSYLTLDPQDLLNGKSQAARYSGVWRQADRSFQNTVYAAAGNNTVEGLFALTGRNGHELDNQGGQGGSGFSREQPNPQQTSSRGVLAKLIVKPAVGQQLRFSYEGRKQDNDVDILRLSPALPKVTGNNGNERADRQRYGIDWEWKPSGAWFDRLLVNAWQQKADNHTYTLQQRTNTSAACSGVSNGSNNCRIDMDFAFTQKTNGAGLQVEKGWQHGGTTHFLLAGADWRGQRVDEMRDYLITNQTTGSVGKTLAGDTYPLRDFAPGKADTLGVFVQDEITLFDGRLMLTPGLRHDTVKLRPEATSKQIGALKFNATEQSHSAFSPKFAALWQVTPTLALFGQVVRGFRAPNYTEVNGLFWNTAQGYATIPNPDLRPETSTGLEVGSRIKAGGGEVKVAVFDNRYDNFISNEVVCSSTGAASCINNSVRSVYQSINLAKVRIRGLELRGAWPLAKGFRVNAAWAYAQGDVTSADQPLNSVEPMRLSLAVDWQGEAGGQPVGGDLRLRAAAGKSRIDNRTTDYFRTPGYTVADFSAWWQLHRQARLNVAVNNLFDQKYWLWSDVRQVGLAQNEAGPNFYSQPGRNLALSLQVDF